MLCTLLTKAYSNAIYERTLSHKAAHTNRLHLAIMDQSV